MQNFLSKNINKLREFVAYIRQENREHKLWGNYKDAIYRYERLFEKEQKVAEYKGAQRFVIFNYSAHNTSDGRNLGDYVQSIATQKAIRRNFAQSNFEFFDRDMLSFYPTSRGGGQSLLCRAGLHGDLTFYQHRI